MKIQIHVINFSVKEELRQFIQQKMDKLETFYKGSIEGEIFLKLNNEGVKNKTIEIKLHVPGNRFFACENATSFEEAADNAIEALRRQLRKFKEKQIDKRP